MKILVTGVTGFVGSYLAEKYLEKDVELFGIRTWRNSLDNVAHIANKIKFFEADITDAHSVFTVIDTVRPDIIHHLAAQSFVPASWQNPVRTFEVNVLGSINLFEAARRYCPKAIVQIASCYSDDTKVLTLKGLQNFKDIKEGEKILSINPNTGEIEYDRVKKVIYQKYKGEMFLLEGRSVSLRVTPNHRVLLKRRPKNRYEYKEAKSLKELNRFYLPKGSWKKDEKIEFLTIDGIRYKLNDLLYLIGLYVGDGYSDLGFTINRNKSKLNHKEYITTHRDNKGKFVEIKNKCETLKRSFSPRIFLAIPEKDKSRLKVVDVLKRLGLKFSEYEKELYFSSWALFKILDECKHNAHKKQIPLWVLDLPANNLEFLYQGLIDSDGHSRKSNDSFSTVSSILRDQMIELSFKLGKFANYSEWHNIAFIKQRKVESKKCYRFTISGNNRLLQRTNIKSVFYKGDICCLELRKNHNFLVCRNGKSLVCGNSSEVYGKQQEMPITEKALPKPCSPYGVSKLAMDRLGAQYHYSYDLNIVITRAFNHTGPRRPEQFVCSSFAKQIVEMEKGLREVITVGNLDAERDFTDVRDVCDAYILSVEKCKFGEPYNICSGTTHKIREVLETLCSLSTGEIKTGIDPEKLRPSDLPILQGRNTKFIEITRWHPKISFRDTMTDLLNYWRKKLSVQK